MTGRYALVDFDSEGNVDTVYGEYQINPETENPELTAGEKQLIEISDDLDLQESDITNAGAIESQAVSTESTRTGNYVIEHNAEGDTLDFIYDEEE